MRKRITGIAYCVSRGNRLKNAWPHSPPGTVRIMANITLTFCWSASPAHSPIRAARASAGKSHVARWVPENLANQSVGRSRKPVRHSPAASQRCPRAPKMDATNPRVPDPRRPADGRVDSQRKDLDPIRSSREAGAAKGAVAVLMILIEFPRCFIIAHRPCW